MRLPLEDWLKKMGVLKILAPYETQPWVFYCEDKGITCSAEVRMGPGSKDLEAEVQFMHDVPPPELKTPIEQILRFRVEPMAEDQWAFKYSVIKGEDYTNEFHDWEGKSCGLFQAIIQSISMGELPDIDALIAQYMVDDTAKSRGKKGKIGRKSPGVNQKALLGVKQGM